MRLLLDSHAVIWYVDQDHLLSPDAHRAISEPSNDLGLTLLPITVDYANQQAGLPDIHRDPFDRLIAAQAKSENVQVISADAIFDRYGVTRLW